MQHVGHRASDEIAQLKRELRETEEALVKQIDNSMNLARQRDLAEIKRADTERMYEAALSEARGEIEFLSRKLDRCEKDLRTWEITARRVDEAEGSTSVAPSRDRLVRPLQWDEVPVVGTEEEVSYWAHHAFGAYAIERDHFSVIPWELVCGGRVEGHYDKLDDAMAAAQSLHERRVRSLLSSTTYDPTTPPYDEPVPTA